jgi:hypothetical protein
MPDTLRGDVNSNVIPGFESANVRDLRTIIGELD